MNLTPEQISAVILAVGAIGCAFAGNLWVSLIFALAACGILNR